MKVFESDGNLGILQRSQYLFVCGGCYSNLEVDADNLETAKQKAREAGWGNGHMAKLGAMPGARGINTRWRCHECRRGYGETFAELESRVDRGIWR